MNKSVTLTPLPMFIRVLLRLAQFVGLCVLIAAVYVLMSLVSHVADAARMRGWTPVEAKILSAEYEPIDDNAGPQVLARYQYRYNGVEYEGTRVDTADGAELVGDFQERMASELAAHILNGTRATAYVNPDQPEESVLYPGFSWTVFAVRLAL